MLVRLISTVLIRVEYLYRIGMIVVVVQYYSMIVGGESKAKISP